MSQPGDKGHDGKATGSLADAGTKGAGRSQAERRSSSAPMGGTEESGERTPSTAPVRDEGDDDRSSESSGRAQVLITEKVLSDFAEEWRKAEKRLKDAELVTQEATIPAINELRYAGYHLCQALRSTSASEALEQSLRGTRHCIRASYDAVEAQIQTYLMAIQVFQDDYKDVVIETDVLDYGELCKTARLANKLLVATAAEVQRAQDPGPGRCCSEKDPRQVGDAKEAACKRGIKYCKTLAPLVAVLPDARQELNKKVREQARNTRKWAIRIIVMILGAILAALVALRGQEQDPSECNDSPAPTGSLP